MPTRWPGRPRFWTVFNTYNGSGMFSGGAGLRGHATTAPSMLGCRCGLRVARRRAAWERRSRRYRRGCWRCSTGKASRRPITEQGRQAIATAMYEERFAGLHAATIHAVRSRQPLSRQSDRRRLFRTPDESGRSFVLPARREAHAGGNGPRVSRSKDDVSAAPQRFWRIGLYPPGRRSPLNLVHNPPSPDPDLSPEPTTAFRNRLDAFERPGPALLPQALADGLRATPIPQASPPRSDTGRYSRCGRLVEISAVRTFANFPGAIGFSHRAMCWKRHGTTDMS